MLSFWLLISSLPRNLLRDIDLSKHSGPPLVCETKTRLPGLLRDQLSWYRDVPSGRESKQTVNEMLSLWSAGEVSKAECLMTEHLDSVCEFALNPCIEVTCLPALSIATFIARLSIP